MLSDEDEERASVASFEGESDTWLRTRVAELERALGEIRLRQIRALDCDEGAARVSDDELAFRQVLDRLPTPLLVLAEDDAVLFANLAAESFFGTCFNALGGGTLAQCIGTERATVLSALRPGERERGSIEALDESGTVQCQAFLAPVGGYGARCIQIAWTAPPELR